MVVDDDELRHGRDLIRVHECRVSSRADGGTRIRAIAPDVTRSTPTLRKRPQRAGRSATRVARAARSIVTTNGEGHREAHPPALPDLVPDGGAPAGHGPRDPPRRRGLQRDERGRLRPALLRRPRRARLAGDPADRRQAARRRRRAGELLAAAGELPPAADRVHRRGARVAAVRADPARRRVRLRRAAAARAPADLLGPAEPAPRAGPAHARARHHRLGGRPRALPAPGQGRDGDLPQQDHHLRLLHDGARRRRRAQGRPVPPALPGRPVLPPRPLARARRAARLPAVAHPGQGRLRDEGRARLQAPRATSTRARTPTAPSGSTATRSAPREIHVSDRLGWQVERHYGRFGEVAPADDGGVVFDDRLREHAPARRLDPRARRARPRRGPAGARRRRRRAPRPARRAPRGRPRPRRRRCRRAARGPRGARPARPTATAAATRPRSAPSASRASSRSPRSSSTPAAPACGCAPRTSASACRSPSRSCARTSTSSTS